MAAQGSLKLAMPAVRTCVICFLASIAWTFGGANRARSASEIYTNWSRDLVETTPNAYRSVDKPFAASMTGSTGELLHLLGRYRLRVKSGTVSLRGSYDANRDFWPAVSLAVSNQRKGHWMPIGVFDPTLDADFLTIHGRNPEARLWVAAEQFRDFIGTHRWGHIGLISDKHAETVFALEDLLPPRSRRRGERDDFKEVLRDRGKLQFGSVAFLHSVVSIKAQLTGEFVYIGNNRGGMLTGIRAETGDFWPEATLEIGNSEGEWIKISETKPSHSSRLSSSKQHTPGDRFRVNLDAYKLNIGKAKFGKVTFADSSFAVFPLQRIDPSVMDEAPMP